MRFFDDDPKTCACCGKTICAGETYYTWRGEIFCDDDCVKSAMMEAFENEVNEEYLSTAEDKALEYGDMLRDMAM